jgi:hypothetical protein
VRWLDESALVASDAMTDTQPRLWRLALGGAPARLTAEGEAGMMTLDPPRRRW